jgi:hypothetical protein
MKYWRRSRKRRGLTLPPRPRLASAERAAHPARPGWRRRRFSVSLLSLCRPIRAVPSLGNAGCWLSTAARTATNSFLRSRSSGCVGRHRTIGLRISRARRRACARREYHAWVPKPPWRTRGRIYPGPPDQRTRRGSTVHYRSMDRRCAGMHRETRAHEDWGPPGGQARARACQSQ